MYKGRTTWLFPKCIWQYFEYFECYGIALVPFVDLRGPYATKGDPRYFKICHMLFVFSNTLIV